MVSVLFLLLLLPLSSARHRNVRRRIGVRRGGARGPAPAPPRLPAPASQGVAGRSSTATPSAYESIDYAKKGLFELIISLLSVVAVMAMVTLVCFIAFGLITRRSSRMTKQSERPLLVEE
jgi:hypothetical protein